MWRVFLEVWEERPHKSEVSGKYLGQEPLSIYFHHLFEKAQYPEGRYDKENIILITAEEHDQIHIDMYYYEEANKRREKLKEKYV